MYFIIDFIYFYSQIKIKIVFRFFNDLTRIMLFEVLFNCKVFIFIL